MRRPRPRTAPRTAVDLALDAFGRIDSVYNAAAVLIPTEAVTAPAEEFVQQLMVNAVGTLNVCHATAAALRKSDCAAIVNTSSVVVDIAGAGRGLDAASKATIPPLTRHLALELGPEVRVNAISPGHTLTEMTEDLYRGQGATLEDGLRKLGSNVMLKRVATPEDIAGTVCFLLSAEACYVTGQVLTVDAGMTAV
ncbi:2,3-dihydro-2,3-dihydroxybenzoate dehydrogenase [Amycolatopsis sulphurea]|uniref:2,3-dihydro-2,3-dihydroxybenzoate dehydrogenase n=1 Tax=Amycolatopsis sulphurea TaxID=76022 RepID=A0A2A9F669_9PSEU|nr:SDR family oxidoreductase [Amycolatopsis sulphurea]PFG46834.1 2,3-dihydro-2,3-dihydroxybenzoate dehydrogenase [Amycolatopsis sulphurea]